MFAFSDQYDSRGSNDEQCSKDPDDPGTGTTCIGKYDARIVPDTNLPGGVGLPGHPVLVAFLCDFCLAAALQSCDLSGFYKQLDCRSRSFIAVRSFCLDQPVFADCKCSQIKNAVGSCCSGQDRNSSASGSIPLPD